MSFKGVRCELLPFQLKSLRADLSKLRTSRWRKGIDVVVRKVRKKNVCMDISLLLLCGKKSVMYRLGEVRSNFIVLNKKAKSEGLFF